MLYLTKQCPHIPVEMFVSSEKPFDDSGVLLINDKFVIVWIFLSLYFLASIKRISYGKVAACPVSCKPALVSCWKHNTVNMIFYVAPCFFALTLKLINMPVNPKVINKVCCYH